MFTSTTQVRVRYAETDQMNVVYHGNYAQYFEVARAESIRELGFTYKEMEALGVIMPIVELHVKFIRPAQYDDLLSIRTTLREMPLHHRIEFFQEVFNVENKLLASGRVVLYFMDAKKMVRTHMPAVLREKLIPFFEPGADSGNNHSSSPASLPPVQDELS